MPIPLTNSQRQKAFRERRKALKAMQQMPRMLERLKANDTLAAALGVDGEPANDVPMFDSVICDWLSISHPLREVHPVVNDGRILRIKANGETEWTSECWHTLKCASSDTSLRIKCDGVKVMMTGNIGRFGQVDNLNGYTVLECIAKWQAILDEYFPNIAPLFGPDFQAVNRETGEVERMGTRITRCDLAGNFFTDNYGALCQSVMCRRLGQRPPRMGKFGPTWGYDSKRGNWLKAKLYDKTCELEGRRIPATGETVARFEVQLGSEILKRRGLWVPDGWKGADMENVIFHEFSKQVFREQATAETWADIPARLRQYAVLWRDGTPLRNQCKSDATYYRVRKQLLEHGIDASQPCNVQTLLRRVEVVKVQPLPARRVA